MYVDTLTVDRLSPERLWSEMTAEPGWPDIEEALRRLNGCESSLLTLGTDRGCMTIGGGRDGAYVVWATFDSQHFHAAVDPARGSEPASVQVHGKDRTCTADQMVNTVVALRAARSFALEGRLDPGVCWKAS